MKSYVGKGSFKATILIVVSAACFSSSIVSPCLPLLVKHFNIETNQTSLVVSIFLFGYLLGQIVFSIISQTFGYKKALITGFLLYTLSTLAQIISIESNYFNIFLYSRFCGAMGSASGLICAFAIINDFSKVKKEIQKLIASAFISLTLFSYLSITLGGFITQYFGWIKIFYFILFASIINLLLVYSFIPNTSKPGHSSVIDLKAIITKYIGSFLCYRLILSSLLVSFTTTTTYLYHAVGSAIATKLFLISPKTFGMYSILNLVGLISGGLAGSVLIKRYKILDIIFIGLTTSSIAIVFFVLLHDVVFNNKSNGLMFFSLIAFLNFGLGLIYPTASYLALNSINSSSTASSIMNFIKIGCPALMIYIISKLNFGLIDSFIKPILFLFFLTTISFLIIKLTPPEEAINHAQKTS